MPQATWTARTYTVACHGCGRVHEVNAYFISSPLAVVMPDGRELGVMGCPDCLKVPGRIRAAYQRIQNGGPVLPEGNAE